VDFRAKNKPHENNYFYQFRDLSMVVGNNS